MKITKISLRFLIITLFVMMLSACSDDGSSGDSRDGIDSGEKSSKTVDPSTSKTIPSLAGATASSNHYVVATFAEAVGAAAEDPDNYLITAPDGSRLAVTEAVLSDDGKSVTLTTASQKVVEYELTQIHEEEVTYSRGFFFNTAHAAPTTDSVTFTGSSTPEPVLMSAISLDNTHLLLTFNDRMAADDVIVLEHYRIVAADDSVPAIDVGGLKVLAADHGDDDTTVVLTTTPQENIEYRIKVVQIRSNKGGNRIDPTRNTSTFFGILPVDIVAPKVVSVASTSATTIIITFSEPLDDDAADPVNFIVTYCTTETKPCPVADQAQLVVTAAELSQHNTQVILTTAAQQLGIEYNVEVINVTDLAGNSIDTTSNAASTVYNGETDLPTVLEPPRVVGAASTGNSSVIVSFNKAMGKGAEEASNYVIVQENIHGEAGALGVVSARYLDDDRTTVELTTLSQNELTYRVTVVNVQDAFGRPLDAVITFGGHFSANSTIFAGTPLNVESFVDTDEDGINDNEEQRGWTITITLVGGETVTREVTSDINLVDSDGDGLTDIEELKLRTDPRDVDTDDDELGDAYEFRALLTNPTNQDSDGDDLSDVREINFFHTSPLLADTDGDQISDRDEVILANRNPRLSDLPQPAIEIGNVDLQLDVRFTATSEIETRELESKSVSSSLIQSESKSHSNTDEVNNEFSAKVATEHTWGNEFVVGVKYEGSISAEVGGTHQWNSSYTTGSSSESQQEYAKSLETQKETTEGELVTREVLGASMKVALTIRSVGDIAFTISNLQVTALLPDKRDPGRFIPIATLVPDIPEDSTIPNTYTLGPLVNERGPFIFANSEVFPALVERLMSSPTGLVFRISNYNITDELERDFAFTSQNIADRTAPIVIDYGGADIDNDGIGDTTERYRVATSFGRSTELVIEEVAASAEVSEEEALKSYGLSIPDDTNTPLVFDLNGMALGVAFHDVMQSVLGLKHYDEDTDPSVDLTPEEKAGSYATKIEDEIEIIYRIRQVHNRGTIDAKNAERWGVLTPEGLFSAGDLTPGDQILLPNKGLRFSYDQDLDGDNLQARLEYLNGCSDSDIDTDDDGIIDVYGRDTDGDGLDDRFEIYGAQRKDGKVLDTDKQWMVNVEGFGKYEAFSRCNAVDSDQDGLFDIEEYDGFIYTKNEDDTDVLRDDTTGEPVRDEAYEMFGKTDPREWDTDGDGISDKDEIKGYAVYLQFPRAGESKCKDATNNPDYPGRDTVTCFSDPLDPDSDGDTLNDGDEIQLGSDPTVNDGADVLDIDGDGLLGREETHGWDVTWNKASTVAGQEGVEVNCTYDFATKTSAGCEFNENQPPTSSTAKVHTDSDGLTDLEEFEFTHPRDPDTDNDGRDDFEELNGHKSAETAPEEPVITDPLDADSDDDTLSDSEEFESYKVGPAYDATGTQLTLENLNQTTNPNLADEDDDGLLDGDERIKRTDASDPDTDKDTVNDGNELKLGSNPLSAAEKCVRVTLQSIEAIKDCDLDPAGGGGEFDGDFKVSLERDSTIQWTSLLKDLSDYGSISDGGTGHIKHPAVSKDFILKNGDRIRMFSQGVREYDGDPYEPFTETEKFHAFGDISSTILNESITEKGKIHEDDCQIKFSYSIRAMTDTDAQHGLSCK